MARVRLITPAQRDPKQIRVYIVQDVREAARRCTRQIRRKLRDLAGSPGIGRARPEPAAALRSFPVDNDLIFHRTIPDGVEIVRVVHGSRDVGSLFPNP